MASSGPGGMASADPTSQQSSPERETYQNWTAAEDAALLAAIAEHGTSSWSVIEAALQRQGVARSKDKAKARLSSSASAPATACPISLSSSEDSAEILNLVTTDESAEEARRIDGSAEKFNSPQPPSFPPQGRE